jgi:hypothetical protein
MTTNRPGVTGMATSHPQEQPNAEAQSLPDEEHIDQGTLEEDLEQDPDEKRNATDGYAPADDGAETHTVDEDLERLED